MMSCLQVYKEMNLSRSAWSSERQKNYNVESEITERHLLECHKNARNDQLKDFVFNNCNINVFYK